MRENDRIRTFGLTRGLILVHEQTFRHLWNYCRNTLWQ